MDIRTGSGNSALDPSANYPTMSDLKDEDVFCTKTSKLIAQIYDYNNLNNTMGRQDLYFTYIDQWRPDDRSSRMLDRQPVLTFNYQLPVLNQLIGEQRSQEPDIICEPANENVRPQDAEIMAGRIREVMYQNKAPEVYQTAFKYALTASYSHIFHDIEYESDESNKLAIKMKCIEQFTSAFFDANAKETDKSDAAIQGYFIDMTKDEFHRRWPEAEVINSFPTYANDPTYNNYFFSQQNIRIVKVWVRIPATETICTVVCGQETQYLPLKEAKEYVEEMNRKRNRIMQLRNQGILQAVPIPPKCEITFKRKSLTHKIIKVLMTYKQILEIQEWPSKRMPGVFVPCLDAMIDGKQYLFSFLRTMQDPLRFLNYVKSAQAENLLNGHHVNWVGTPANVKGDLLQYWKMPNRSKTILLANYDEKGNLPQPVNPPEISASFFQMSDALIKDLMGVTGRYEALSGQQGNEKSGTAIDKRAMYSSMSSFLPFDNLKRAINSSAQIIMDLLPAVTDDNESIVVRNKDGKRESKMPGRDFSFDYIKKAQKAQMYNVRIEVGASQAVQKMANFNMMLQLIQADPQVAPLIIDLMAQNLDLENVQQIVERLRENIVPPAVIAKEEGKPMPQPSPQQQQQAQLMQALQALPLQELKVKQMQAQTAMQKTQLDAQKFAKEQDMQRMQQILEQQRLQHEMLDAKEHAEIEKGWMGIEEQKLAQENHHKHLEHLVNLAALKHNNATQHAERK